MDLALRLADAAREPVRRHFRTGFEVLAKADESPVTVADREAEAAMRPLIAAAFPQHGIQGEEFGLERGEADWIWHLDPIDGTSSYISGIPTFGTLIGLSHRGRAVLGVMDQAITGERWSADGSGPARLNGDVIRARPCGALAEAALFTTSTDYMSEAQAAGYRRLAAEAGYCRYSADCYAFAALASGSIDIVVEGGMSAHDICALIPIIEGAGGWVGDWRGRPLRMDRPIGGVLALGDPGLLADAIARLAGA